MTHDELCERALRWLSGTKRCNPVYSRCASCSEIPDAIGWSSAGSIVIECKTSVSDFYADKKKRKAYIHPDFRFRTFDRVWPEQKDNFREVELPLMGDYRFYLCEPGILTPEMIAKHAPDHGLVFKDGRKMRVILSAPLRTNVNKDAEIRYLRFAIINGKMPT